MIEVYTNTQVRVQEKPKEDFEIDYHRERMILNIEREYDLRRIERVENDIMKMDLYDF